MVTGEEVVGEEFPITEGGGVHVPPPRAKKNLKNPTAMFLTKILYPSLTPPPMVSKDVVRR